MRTPDSARNRIFKNFRRFFVIAAAAILRKEVKEAIKLNNQTRAW
jgi:hypothetical protein